MHLIKVLTLICLSTGAAGYCQRAPVVWTFNAERVNGSEWMVLLEATLPPGWHIYSQFMKDDGPMPTSIALEQNGDYVSAGKFEESGKAITHYDRLYEMDITWYTGEVTFLQKVKLLRPVVRIKGTISYMMCSEHQCILQHEDFNIQTIRSPP